MVRLVDVIGAVKALDVEGLVMVDVLAEIDMAAGIVVPGVVRSITSDVHVQRWHGYMGDTNFTVPTVRTIMDAPKTPSFLGQTYN